MTPIKGAGSVLSLLNGAWAAYIASVLLNTPYSCPNGGCPPTTYPSPMTMLLWVGLVLVVASLVSLRGFRVAFIMGAALSVIVVILVALQWRAFGGVGPTISVALSAAAILADSVAAIPGRSLSEEGHPLNLPVFG